MTSDEKQYAEILRSAIRTIGLSISKSEHHVEDMLNIISSERLTIRMEKKRMYKVQAELDKFLNSKSKK